MKRFNWVAVLLILLGLYWLLSAIGMDLHIGPILWPLVIFLIGVFSIASARRATFWNLLLILGGAYWALVNLNIVPPLSFSVWLPVVIILLGVSVLFSGRIGIRSRAVGEGKRFNSAAVFGGDTRRFTGKEFGGGSVLCVFGGNELDLTGYESFPDVQRIEVMTVFGGADLRIPSHVRVERRGLMCLFGGYGVKGQPQPDASHVIEIGGLVLFGGVEVKYY